MFIDIVLHAAGLGKLCNDDAVAFNAGVHTVGKTAWLLRIGAFRADAAGIPGEAVGLQTGFPHSLLYKTGCLLMGKLSLKRLCEVHAVPDLVYGGEEKSSPVSHASFPAFRNGTDRRRTGPAASISLAFQPADAPNLLGKRNLIRCQETVFKHGKILNQSFYMIFNIFKICHGIYSLPFRS